MTSTIEVKEEINTEKIIGSVSSESFISKAEKPVEILPFPAEINATESTEDIKTEELPVELDEEAAKRETPLFKELALPILPELEKENRLYLQMQSPKRIFLYWSVKTNAYKNLTKAFGENAGGYTLVAKLMNLSRKTENVFPVDGEGSAWFDVADDTKYQTEIGFFSPSRPFVRIAFSNEIETPRMSPSPNQDVSPVWNVSTMQFAEVLESSGFTEDAFEVALSSTESEQVNSATETIYARITGEPEAKFAEFDMNELRSVLLAIAGGVPFAAIVDSVSAELSAWLSLNPEVFEAANVMAILQETFGEEFGTFVENAETETTGVVFGASRVNFGNLRSRFGFPGTRRNVTSSRTNF